MAVSEAAMLDRSRKGARCDGGLFERSLTMGNTVELSDVLLEPNEAAAFLKVSLSWLAKARATNEGPPFIRIGRCVRYSKGALLRWLKSRER
jgi:predicted DNA-binding transcriptional regulator AlpA